MTDRLAEIRRLQQMRQQKARQIRDLDARIRQVDQTRLDRTQPEPREDWDGAVYGSDPALETRG